MPDDPPRNLESFVLTKIKMAFRSHEEWESERPEDIPPYGENQTLFMNWASLVHQQGIILGLLSVVPSTRAELQASMPGMDNRVPAWMDAHLHGQRVMTLELFSRGMAQMLKTHRAAIERVIAEQVSDPEPIEKELAEAPVPAGREDEARSVLMSGVAFAASAHTKALVDIAYDLEMQFGRVDFGAEG